jgi:hypothetical protein
MSIHGIFGDMFRDEHLHNDAIAFNIISISR